MTGTLRRVVDRIQQLSAERQDALAEVIERELEEREWDDLVSRPASQRLLADLAAEARQVDVAGLPLGSASSWQR